MNQIVIDNTIPGWASETHLAIFASIANLLNHHCDQPKILEVGTWLGRSIWAFSENCPNGSIVSVDIANKNTLTEIMTRQIPNSPMDGDSTLWGVDDIGITDACKKIITQKQWETKINNIASYSLGSDNFFYNNEDFFDMIYLDGSHNEDQVFRDLINSLDVLSTGGVIIVDDYDYKNSKWTGVKVAVDNLCKYYPKISTFQSNKLNGCIVLFKDKTTLTSDILACIDSPLPHVKLPWCAEPFINLHHTADGTYQICCISRGNSDPMMKTSEISPIDFINSPYAKTIRSDMMEGKLSKTTLNACNNCIINESALTPSRRTTRNKWNMSQETFNATISKFAENYNANLDISDLRHVNLKVLGNLCNLKCIMCNPTSSSKIAAEYKKHNITMSNKSVILTPYNNETKDAYFSDIVEIAGHLDTFILVGGESLLNPDFAELYQLLSDNKNAKNLNLIIISNGTILPELVSELADCFKNVRLIFSLDGIGEQGSYIRSGLDWELFDRTVHKAMATENLDVSFTIAIQVLNIGYLDDVLDYINILGLTENDINWGNIVAFPIGFRAVNLPPEIKKRYLDKYSNHAISKMTTPTLLAALHILNTPEVDHELFIKGIQAFAAKDKIRQTNLLDHFPEFSKYYKEIK
jgi:hypothetical protein